MANVERLKAVRQAILDHQEKFRYTSWCTKGKNGPLTLTDFSDIVDPDCGTCGCVAGFALGLYANEDIPDINSNRHSVGAEAKHILELTDAEEAFLFYCFALDDIPIIKADQANVEEAIKRIDYLIAKHST